MTEAATNMIGSATNADQPDDTGDEQPEYRPSAFRTRVVPGLALALVVALLGLLAYSLFAPERARLGERGRVNPFGALVLEDGREAPDFSVETFDGEQFQLSELRGNIVVINFWASWCPPCRDEMPLLVHAAERLGEDVVLVGVDIWDDVDDARAFLASYRVTYPNVHDADGRIGIGYGVTGVPETFVVNADGRIVVRLPGPVTSMEQLRDMVAEARS
ncbi:MAG TPA: TlpA disulfide reductase family protein [Thermomicrobiales bacterium]|nr:TlpA disulfide reductase family protein [Thermomicrobiales bacterium]